MALPLVFVFPLCCRLIVSTSAIGCLERLVSEMTYYVSSGTLNLYTLTLQQSTDLAARIISKMTVMC